MKKMEKATKEEKSYSYDEFLQEFYPKRNEEKSKLPKDPKEFGKVLAENAIRKIREQLEQV